MIPKQTIYFFLTDLKIKMEETIVNWRPHEMLDVEQTTNQRNINHCWASGFRQRHASGWSATNLRLKVIGNRSQPWTSQFRATCPWSLTLITSQFSTNPPTSEMWNLTWYASQLMVWWYLYLDPAGSEHLAHHNLIQIYNTACADPLALSLAIFSNDNYTSPSRCPFSRL
jgi:hypothetical protein